MRVNRAFVDAPLAPGMRLPLPETAATHLLRVLRLREGDACVLFNGDGNDYPARISSAGKRGGGVEILGCEPVDNESPLRITLLQGIARGEKMDLVLQKATELGVTGIVPVDAERTEVRLDGERLKKRVAHWRRVVASACEQCGRARVPEVAEPLALADAVSRIGGTGMRLMLDPAAAPALPSLALATDAGVVLAIGPEGGWSPQDRAALRAAGYQGVRLGPRILRTETAGLAAIAVLQAVHGDLAR